MQKCIILVILKNKHDANVNRAIAVLKCSSNTCSLNAARLNILLYHSRKIISDCQIHIYVIGWNWNHNKHWPMRWLESDVMFFHNMAFRTPCLWFWPPDIRSYKYKSVCIVPKIVTNASCNEGKKVAKKSRKLQFWHFQIEGSRLQELISQKAKPFQISLCVSVLAMNMTTIITDCRME